MRENDLLKKWLNNDLTDTEKKVFSKQSDYIENQKIIKTAQHFKASHFSKADNFDTFKTNYQKTTTVKRLDWVKPLLRIASVFVIGLVIYFSFFNNKLIEARTLASEKSSISLPDLSEVMLNANSEITYDATAWASNRHLNLKGEAYFKVAKGNTFDVLTTQGTVTVVGTQFNVKSRPNYFEVKCYEGIVKVTSNNITRQLLAGDSYRILNNTFSEDKIKNTEPSWLHNTSLFKATPLKDVVSEIERQYNIKVSFKNVDTSRLFTGAFAHDHLENALIAITQPMNLSFKISSSNQVLIHDKKD